MGASGEDILLSDAARQLFPFSVECKNRARIALYKDYQQTVENTPRGVQPLLIIKQNHSRPLAVVDAEWFITGENNEE